MVLSFDHRLAIAIVMAVVAIAVLAYTFLVPHAPPVDDSDRAAYLCIFLCKAAQNEGRVLDNGPCLSSGFSEWEMGDWVCDVAHSPRQPVDNDPANQCSEYGVTASHFVEVNPLCGFIRAV